jgi:hypothetical protein
MVWIYDEAKGNKSSKRKIKNSWLNIIENDMRAIGVCEGISKIKTSGGLGQGSSTTNSWEKGEGGEEESYEEKKNFNLIE